MDAPADPTQPDAGSVHETHDEQMRVRRSPKYGVFMAIGALLGAVAAWLLSSAMPPSTDANGTPVDTSPVLGLAIVVGFVAGAALGGLIAWIIDRSLSKRLSTVTVERTEVREVHEAELQHGAGHGADASAGTAVEAEFQPLQSPAAGATDADADSRVPEASADDAPDAERDRPREA